MAQMTFDAVEEAAPGPKWAARWQRSWPAYEAWFRARGGDQGPSRAACRAALRLHMPELLPVYDRLVGIAGGSDRAARFLSTWCPPRYLGGCSVAAVAGRKHVRLVRNYDLSPELNEGLLLCTRWTGRPVMGMSEFLWGLSDGINAAGLAVALAYGGRSETAPGFGITTILRYVLETCDTVDQAVEVLRRVPSHMAYNVVLADAHRNTASVEMQPGGGLRRMPHAVATNHQSGQHPAERPRFTRTFERHAFLRKMRAGPRKLRGAFLKPPLLQDRHAEGFGTLFTAEYDPRAGAMTLLWGKEAWAQSFEAFEEGRRVIVYPKGNAHGPESAARAGDDTGPPWHLAAGIDWQMVSRDYARGCGRPIKAYLSEVAAGDADLTGHGRWHAF